MRFEIDDTIYTFYENDKVVKKIQYEEDDNYKHCKVIYDDEGPSMDYLINNYIIPNIKDDRMIVKWGIPKGKYKYAVFLDDGSIVKFGNKKNKYYVDRTPFSRSSTCMTNDEIRSKFDMLCENTRHHDGRLSHKVKYTKLWLCNKYLY